MSDIVIMVFILLFRLDLFEKTFFRDYRSNPRGLHLLMFGPIGRPETVWISSFPRAVSAKVGDLIADQFAGLAGENSAPPSAPSATDGKKGADAVLDRGVEWVNRIHVLNIYPLPSLVNC